MSTAYLLTLLIEKISRYGVQGYFKRNSRHTPSHVLHVYVMRLSLLPSRGLNGYRLSMYVLVVELMPASAQVYWSPCVMAIWPEYAASHNTLININMFTGLPNFDPAQGECQTTIRGGGSVLTLQPPRGLRLSKPRNTDRIWSHMCMHRQCAMWRTRFIQRSCSLYVQVRKKLVLVFTTRLTHESLFGRVSGAGKQHLLKICHRARVVIVQNIIVIQTGGVQCSSIQGKPGSKVKTQK